MVFRKHFYCVVCTRSAIPSIPLVTGVILIASFLFLVVSGDLTAGPNASPPGNLRKVLIMFASVVALVAGSMVGLEGKQVRRQRDEERQRQQD